MGMTIDEHIKVLESLFKGRKGFTGQPIDFQGSVDFAIYTMRKYQKIEQIVKKMKDSKSDIVGLNRHNTEYYMNMIERILKDGNDD